MDHQLGRVMNHNLAEYHVPVNKDINDIDVIFVEEHEDIISPIGAKGLGEIGIVGVAAAIGKPSITPRASGSEISPLHWTSSSSLVAPTKKPRFSGCCSRRKCVFATTNQDVELLQVEAARPWRGVLISV